MELCLIWAQGRNREIGRANTLPWRLPEDLRRFKALTTGCPVLMGRLTFESLPSGPLPNRLNIVLSRSWQPDGAPAGVALVNNLEHGLRIARQSGALRAFVIGGQALYETSQPIADRIFVTDVDVAVPDADAYAPEISSRYHQVGSVEWKQSVTGLRYCFGEWSHEAV